MSTIEDSMENWKSIAQRLEDASMKKEDIGTAGQLGNAIHTLDKLDFEQDLPFVFYPSEPDGTHEGYEDGKYHIHVQGIHDVFTESENGLKASWPPYTHELITQNLIVYSRGIELVRFRAQEQLGIELFTLEHAGKIRTIPVLNQVIQANAQFAKLISDDKDDPKKFDAHIIGTYAAMIAYQCESAGILEKKTAQQIIGLAKLDVRELL